ncbi:hypothetical protein NCCP1664_19930, partial [Zafaria cholistanensis]
MDTWGVRWVRCWIVATVKRWFLRVRGMVVRGARRPAPPYASARPRAVPAPPPRRPDNPG